MIKEFFSEKEMGKESLNTEDINYTVYNGIISVYQKYKTNFCKEFPQYCEDAPSSVICGVNEVNLKSAIKAQIPKLETPLHIVMEYEEDDYEIDAYSVLDFLEFCYDNICDYTQGGYHSYWKHHHLTVELSNNSKEKFKNDINRILERNGVKFYMDDKGQVKRYLPTQMEQIIKNINLETSDDRLNELLKEAIDKFQNPDIQYRKLGLEKIWDAFERMKTFYGSNKRLSVEQLLREVAGESDAFYDTLDTESRQLTDIGNKYQIRHFEQDKIEVKSVEHIDYLFYRMIAFINLCVSKLEKKNF